MTEQSIEFDVFLSHNSKDKPQVRHLYDLLEGLGIRCFLDIEELVPGAAWITGLEQAAEVSHTFAVFLSPNNISPWHLAELHLAQRLQQDDPDRRVIPVLLPADNEYDPEVPGFLGNNTWVDFRKAGLEDQTGIIRLLAGIWGLSPKKARERYKEFDSDNGLPLKKGLPAGSRLPHPPNPAFTGREAELQTIAAALLADENANLLITQSVTGMGGLGKTQLAAEFCHRYGGRFTGVHWLNCQNPETVDSEIVECGLAMSLPLPDTDLPAAVGLTLAAWRVRGPRLVVLDNLEREADLRLIRGKLQPGGDLRLLLTARNAQWSPDLVAQSLPLATFTPDESRAFLRRWLGDAPPDADLDALAVRLGHLPLALHLAARYLHATRTKIPAYLDRLTAALDDPSLDNWQPDGGSPTGHNLSLKASFLVSWEQIQNETAHRVFLLAAWCAPNQPIPLALLARSADIDEDALRATLPALEAAGLLAYDPGDDRPSLHPLLAEFGRALDIDKTAMTAFANALARESYLALETGLPVAFVPLRPHLESFAPLAEATELEAAAALLNNLGYHLNAVAAYAAARPLFERALAIRGAALGPDHPDTAQSLNSLALLLQDLGDLPAARSLHERALAIREAALGPDHPDTAQSFNNLAGLLKTTGDLQAARPLYERALAICEKNLGPDHPNTATCLNGLASLLQDLGDLQAARSLYERALAIDEKAYGHDHPEVATDLNNLAGLLKTTGDLTTARRLYERALAIREAILGLDHPHTANSINNLASLLYAAGDLPAARPLFERALAIHDAALGPDHPNTATSLNNLAYLLQATGDLAAARPLLERALAIHDAALGPDHPDTANSLNGLASLLKTTGDLTTARRLYERALAILEAKLPPGHPTTELVRRNLAGLVEEMERK